MLAIFRAHRYNDHRQYLTLVIIVSWLFMLVSATCVMPMVKQTPVVNTMMPGCSEPMNHGNQTEHFSPQLQDCALKSCPDYQPPPVFNTKIDKSEIPLLIIFLVCLIAPLFSYRPPQLLFNRIKPPSGKPIPLIYRFCTLLN